MEMVHKNLKKIDYQGISERPTIIISKISLLKKRLESFSKGENLRILHIGNIANNAYLAARSERHIGIESYVLSIDYTHIMGAPEWEHCEVARPQDKHFDSGFSDCSCIFQRPEWFLDGSLVSAVSSIMRALSPNEEDESTRNVETSKKLKMSLKNLSSKIVSLIWKLLRPIGKKFIPVRFRAGVIGNLYHTLRKKTQIDLSHIFEKFDIINMYGSSPYLISNIIMEKESRRKFVATEHGTLRDYIFAKYPLSQDTKIGYEKSNAVFVTNQDCLPVALKLRIPIVIKMPHPVNDDLLEDYRSIRKFNICKKQKIILVPSRHSISLDIDRGKGNENVYEVIKNFPRNFADVKFVLIAWGDNVEGAKNLLKREEEEGLVEWIDVLSRPLLKQLMTRSICILDQFKIEAYGAVTVDGIGLGVPVITSHSCENDLSYFGSCAPVFSAITPKDILAHITQIVKLDPHENLKHFEYSTKWYDNNLSELISLESRLRGYLESLQS